MLTGGDIGIRACMHHSVLLGATADNTVGGRVTALVSPRGGPRYSIGRPPAFQQKSSHKRPLLVAGLKRALLVTVPFISMTMWA